MSIRPFEISVPDSEIRDLQRRLRETRWPVAIPGAGWEMGMDDLYLRSLAEYWLTRFDWRTIEATLNRVPQFLADTAGGTVHFVHLRGVGPSPLPIVLTHGWPSTYAELLQLGAMLADPTAHGVAAVRTFDVVIPSLPGFAFSPAPAAVGTNVFAIADQWTWLMEELGYSRFIAHGGDIGAGVSTALGLRHKDRIIGVHLNYIPASYQPYLATSSGLSGEEKAFLAARAAWADREGGYSHVQATKPDVLGPSLNDSPVGLAAWIIDKYRSWSDCDGDLDRRFARDELLTAVSLYWFTRSMPSAIRLYWEGRRRPMTFLAGDRVEPPVAIAHFPKELPTPPRSYVERGYNVTRWTEFLRGGHFAALEEPSALAADIREFCRSLSV
jgi:pimeloyl-ACP methyl ester carboxylesterase